MKATADKSSQASQSKANANRLSQQPFTQRFSLESPETAAFEFEDNRTGTIAQRKLQELANNSPIMVAQRKQMEGILGGAVQKSEKGPLNCLSPGADANHQRLIQKQMDAGVGHQPLQFENDFTFGGGTVEITTIDNQADLDEEVEEVINVRYGDYQSLFLVNEVASSPAQWTSLVYDYMNEAYDLDGLDATNVRTAVNSVKDKYREKALLHLAQNLVYGQEYPYSAENLRTIMEGKGIFIEDKDETVLEALYVTEGKFARTKVDVASGNLELSDEDNIVVIIDSHQNKHHSPQLPELEAYTGGAGSRFASNKKLAWHRTNTVPVVRNTIAQAIEDEDVGKDGTVYSPSKGAIDGIIYDLSIVYDEGTGKFVGTYHCNPVESED